MSELRLLRAGAADAASLRARLADAAAAAAGLATARDDLQRILNHTQAALAGAEERLRRQVAAAPGDGAAARVADLAAELASSQAVVIQLQREVERLAGEAAQARQGASAAAERTEVRSMNLQLQAQVQAADAPAASAGGGVVAAASAAAPPAGPARPQVQLALLHSGLLGLLGELQQRGRALGRAVPALPAVAAQSRAAAAAVDAAGRQLEGASQQLQRRGEAAAAAAAMGEAAEQLQEQLADAQRASSLLAGSQTELGALRDALLPVLPALADSSAVVASAASSLAIAVATEAAAAAGGASPSRGADGGGLAGAGRALAAEVLQQERQLAAAVDGVVQLRCPAVAGDAG